MYLSYRRDMMDCGESDQCLEMKVKTGECVYEVSSKC